jgi:UDPglucose 6-dehydrogenase
MRIVIVGAGYVGLVTGTGLSDLGHDVLIYDIDTSKIAALSAGRIPIYEPGLADLVHRNQRNGRLTFATHITDDYAASDAYFIAVGTPPAEDGSADLSAVMIAATKIRSTALKDAFVVVKSTVPVGTCDAVQAVVGRTPPARRLEVISNPEFLKEGDAVNDFFRPDRLVIGARSDRAREFMRELYAPLQLCGDRQVVTDPRSSELVKYASNAMLATRISFMNELARLCHVTGADIHSVRLGVGRDSRIGNRFLYAGPGYGGSCFPKDVQALAAIGRAHGIELEVTEATHRANEKQGAFVADLLEQAIDGELVGKRIAIWGCAFKPDTDDVREAPAVKLTEALLERGATVVAHDPEAMPNFFAHFDGDPHVMRSDRDYDALDGANALVLLTEWRCYRAPDFAKMRARMAGAEPLILDARNIWKAADVTRAGLRYRGIGVPGGDPSSSVLDHVA